MSLILVDTAALKLSFDDIDMPCSIGRSGTCLADEKREGDGRTPLGLWPLRAALFHPGRAQPPAGITLPWRWTSKHDGWSDSPDDPNYNRPVALPHPFGTETLQREDALYDIVIVLGHNGRPPLPGKGSAIFFHIWNNGAPTEGCVAISRDNMDRLLPKLTQDNAMEIF